MDHPMGSGYLHFILTFSKDSNISTEDELSFACADELFTQVTCKGSQGRSLFYLYLDINSFFIIHSELYREDNMKT